MVALKSANSLFENARQLLQRRVAVECVLSAPAISARHHMWS